MLALGPHKPPKARRSKPAKEKKSMRTSVLRLQQFARRRAERQALRIPWQRLHESCNQYIELQEFFLWVRSIIESAGDLPNWLTPVLDDRCPGFLRAEQELTAKAARARPLALRLEDWIDEHIFAVAKEQGWFNAITYYSVRDPRYQRAEVCWSECVRKWREDKPLQYPSFEEWKALAAQCDETAHLLPGQHKIQSSFKLVHPDRLGEAVSRYIDWEALAYWFQLAQDHCPELPAEVAFELDRRCPGFLAAGSKGRGRGGGAQFPPFEPLMNWITEGFFQDAKIEGWLDAVLSEGHNHPRSIRTREYTEYCDKRWRVKAPSPFPSFRQWRHEADSYVEVSDGEAVS